MPQHEYLNRIGPLAARSQDDQLEHLPKNQVAERQNHAAQHAASRRSHGGQNRTSAPVTGFPNGTGIPLVSHTYPGNRPDVTQFATVLDELCLHYRAVLADGALGEVTVVFDAGQNSTANTCVPPASATSPHCHHQITPT
jgi:hypothetical protein